MVVIAGHVAGTRGSGIVSSVADVRGMRGVGGICDMCMCLARGSVGAEGMSGAGDWVWALPILWEQGECWTCVCAAVVWVGILDQGLERWCYVCVSCESGFSV